MIIEFLYMVYVVFDVRIYVLISFTVGDSIRVLIIEINIIFEIFLYVNWDSIEY